MPTIKTILYFCSFIFMPFKSFITICTILVCLGACRKDQSILKGAGTLGFSADTVYFDTVFTRLPGSSYPRSINKRFMVRNPYKESVNVNVQLLGGVNSPYRINVDGKSGATNTLEILPKDSAWVFVEATLEPNNLTQPAIVRDRIEFETNGNRQYVELAAYGWDAYYFRDTVLDNSTTNWTLTDKPYVIVNTCFVDVGKSLLIGPGVHVYSSTNSFLVDSNNKKFGYHALNILGTLKVNGTFANPVIFEGDRLDNNYANTPGQWQGIGFYKTSVDNVLTHCIIKNAAYGVRVDSLSNNANPKLLIKNSIIKNMSGVGIWGRTGEITAINTVVSNCGIFNFYAQYGGRYNFNFCSMNNVTSGGRDPHFYISNQERNEDKVVIRTYPIGYTFVNCIFYGPNESEMGFDLSAPATPNIIQKCLIKSKNPFGVDNLFPTVTYSKLFVDASGNNLKLVANALPINAGLAATGVNTDLEEKSRDANPDIGAYEF